MPSRPAHWLPITALLFAALADNLGACGGTVSTPSRSGALSSGDAGDATADLTGDASAGQGSSASSSGSGSGADAAGAARNDSGATADTGSGADTGAAGPDGSSIISCVARTCADYPTGTCGIQPDHCGGLTAKCTGPDAGAGSLCAPGQFCGGGGFALCGGGTPVPDAGPPCMPKTCADFPAGICGQQGDTCGGLTAICGLNDAGQLCPAGQYCGAGGPGLCG
jgi:hypothetical protein